jgi:hypothetical protein
MCEDPIKGTEATLVVEPATDGRSLEALDAAIGVVGGTVETELAYGSLRVTLPEERVADLCSLAGFESVETVDVLGMAGDAGEDH